MSTNGEVPLAVTRLLSARYPTLEVDPSWLRRCVETLRHRDPAPRHGTPDQLARAVRQTLLDSDLASLVPASYARLTTAALRSGKIGDAARGAVLVQIESMLDIGYSASTQLEIAEARREARRSNLDPNATLSETKAAPPTADHMADFQAQEDDKVQATTVFPRRMLRVELSDGREKAVAIELQRVGGLDMNTTRVGTKLLLKGVKVKDGYLMMTPQNVLVEGGWVEEKERVAEDRLIERLRAQLGKGPEKDTAASGVIANGADGEAAARGDRGHSPDQDEYLAAMEADQEMLAASSSTRPPATRGSAANPNRTLASTATAQPPPAVTTARPRATLIVPESLAQGSTGNPRSQQSDTVMKSSATQEDPISLIDSEDDEFYDVPDEALLELDEPGTTGGVKPQQQQRGRNKVAMAGLSNNKHEPIVIESSPEP